jgi:hypothetical protein
MKIVENMVKIVIFVCVMITIFPLFIVATTNTRKPFLYYFQIPFFTFFKIFYPILVTFFFSHFITAAIPCKNKKDCPPKLCLFPYFVRCEVAKGYCYCHWSVTQLWVIVIVLERLHILWVSDPRCYINTLLEYLMSCHLTIVMVLNNLIIF